MLHSGAQFGPVVVASRVLENDLLGAIFGECESPIFEYTPLRASAGSLRSLAQKSPKPLEEKGQLEQRAATRWCQTPSLGLRDLSSIVSLRCEMGHSSVWCKIVPSAEG